MVLSPSFSTHPTPHPRSTCSLRGTGAVTRLLIAGALACSAAFGSDRGSSSLPATGELYVATRDGSIYRIETD